MRYLFQDALENIGLVVEPPVVHRVEEPGKDEGVEYESHHDYVALVQAIRTKDLVVNEVEGEENHNDHLILHRPTKDHVHVSSEKSRSMSIRLPVQ